jgi:hypothetical protein
MVNALFEKGREGFLDGTIDWDTNTIKMALVDPATATTGIKAITAASNATPIVVTATAHGFTNGDLVYIDGVGGNLAANGFWKIANQATNTFELTDPISAANSVGSAAYTSGGYAINYGPSAAGDNLDDFAGALVGTAQTLTTPTVVAGVAGAANPTWTSVTAGNTIRGVMFYKDTGTPSTSRIAGMVTGKFIVTTAAAAATSATSIAVEKLPYGIPNGTVLTFSDGKTATLSGAATAGDRTLTVTALASGIAVEKRALAPYTGSGFPIPTNGGNITFSIDTGANKLSKL